MFLSRYEGADPSRAARADRFDMVGRKKQAHSTQQTSTSGCNAQTDTSRFATTRRKQGTSRLSRYHRSQRKAHLLALKRSLPLRRRMDDEEEDMSQPISHLWGTSFRDVKYEDRATPIAAGQALAAVTAAVPTSQSHNNNSISVNTLPCSLHWQPRIPFHGNAGLRSHFPAQFEPMEDRGERQIEEEEEEEEGRGEEDDRMAERPVEQAGVSVEAQIGRKLREIGDKFQQDHVELVSQCSDTGYSAGYAFHETPETKPACLDAPYDGPDWLSVSETGSRPPPERRAEMKGLPAGPRPRPLFSLRRNKGPDF
ncbi:hypothetical protein INR49_017654 [Caranx melampygus]|nr:hypothetical protein INR49_017654 [Caranx melampygus]